MIVSFNLKYISIRVIACTSCIAAVSMANDIIDHIKESRLR